MNAWDALRPMNSTCLEERRVRITPNGSVNLIILSVKEEAKLSAQQYANDDSSINPTLFYPYDIALSNQRNIIGNVCAGSKKSAKRIVETLYPKAKEIQIGKGYKCLFAG